MKRIVTTAVAAVIVTWLLSKYAAASFDFIRETVGAITLAVAPLIGIEVRKRLAVKPFGLLITIGVFEGAFLGGILIAYRGNDAIGFLSKSLVCGIGGTFVYVLLTTTAVERQQGLQTVIRWFKATPIWSVIWEDYQWLMYCLAYCDIWLAEQRGYQAPNGNSRQVWQFIDGYPKMSNMTRNRAKMLLQYLPARAFVIVDDGLKFRCLRYRGMYVWAGYQDGERTIGFATLEESLDILKKVAEATKEPIGSWEVKEF